MSIILTKHAANSVRTFNIVFFLVGNLLAIFMISLRELWW